MKREILIAALLPLVSLAAALDEVDPMIGTEGAGSEYGGMMPMTGVPFGSMHLVPVTRTNAVGRTSFNALDKNLLGFCLTRQPAIWMGEFGPSASGSTVRCRSSRLTRIRGGRPSGRAAGPTSSRRRRTARSSGPTILRSGRRWRTRV